MRKLASIKTVSELTEIPDRDRIEIATIDGWHVIVKKGEFDVGARCVYVEIDSVMPKKPEFEFLRSKNFRIKTMKMAGVISQGICFPLNILPPGNYVEGQDVTSIIGVKQYEPTMDKEPLLPTNSKNKLSRFHWIRKLISSKNCAFPSFIGKTDETRIQNIPYVLEDKREWIATEKIDGQSGTFVLVRHKRFLLRDKFEYIVCSRNMRLLNKDNSSYWTVSDKYNIEAALKNMIGYREWIAIQGECIAPNVQGNKYKIASPDLYVFNLIYPTGIVDSIRAKSICENHGLNFVPILQDDYILPDTVNEVLEYAHGESAIGNTIWEGIVFRSKDGKQSFKAVDPLFLIKYNE